MIACSVAAGLPDVERAVPLGDGREVRPDEPVDVVADPVRQLGGVLDHEARPAGQRAPDPERDGEPVAALDRPVARAEQPERRPRSRGQHHVARQRHPVPAEEARRPRTRAGPAGARGAAAGRRSTSRTTAHSNVASWSTSLMIRRPSAGSISRSRWRSRRGRSARPARAARRRCTPAARSGPAGRRSSSRRRRPGCPARCPRRRGSPRAAATGRAAGSAG